MPFLNPAGSLAGPLAFFGQAPITQPSGPSGTVSYTSSPQGSVYATTVLALLNAANVGDLNTLRVAYENLRVLVEQMWVRQQTIEAALKSLGLTT